MRIRPTDFEIPEKDPFKNDLLNRKEPVEILTHLMESLEGPYTMAVDSSWGNGKTTFLNMWKQYLLIEGFPVVSFNAWETDFAGSPFVALASELLSTLKTYESKYDLELDIIESKIKKMHRILLTKGIPGMISLAGSFVSIQENEPLVAPIATTVASAVSIALKEIMRDEPQNELPDPMTYHDAKTEIESFRENIQNIASTLSTKSGDKPLVIIVDELDRCRPLYAVELLEIVKHFFSADHVVFVLAIDKSQLVHAIKALYGNEFDSIGYLRRFIDLDFRLPDPNRAEFVVELLARTGVKQFLEENQGHSWGSPSDIRGLLSAFLSLPVLSLRRIEQAMYRLGLVFASLDSPSILAYSPAAMAIILRTIDPVTYHRFVRADMTDKEVSDHLFGLPGIRSIKWTEKGALLEALLIIADSEFTAMNGIPPKPLTSSLYVQRNRESNKSGGDSIERTHAKQVMNSVEERKTMYELAKQGKPVGFNLAVQRIELFSTDLLEDNEETQPKNPEPQ